MPVIGLGNLRLRGDRAAGSACNPARQKKSPEYEDASEYAADEGGEIVAWVSAQTQRPDLKFHGVSPSMSAGETCRS
jgi:hypothetical protein